MANMNTVSNIEHLDKNLVFKSVNMPVLNYSFTKNNSTGTTTDKSRSENPQTDKSKVYTVFLNPYTRIKNLPDHKRGTMVIYFANGYIFKENSIGDFICTHSKINSTFMTGHHAALIEFEPTNTTTSILLVDQCINHPSRYNAKYNTDDL